MLDGSTFRMEDFFVGRAAGFGLFQDPFGAVRRRFAIDVVGEMRDGVLVLNEHLRFEDGQEERRVWRMQPRGGGRYEGRTQDLPGVARGLVKDGALAWSYPFDLALGSRTLRVRYEESFTPLGGGLLMNRARVSKWGLPLGQVSIVFQQGAVTATVPPARKGLATAFAA